MVYDNLPFAKGIIDNNNFLLRLCQMIFMNKIPWNQSNTSHVNEWLKINGDVHCCFQLGFLWIAYFSLGKKKTGDRLP